MNRRLWRFSFSQWDNVHAAFGDGRLGSTQSACSYGWWTQLLGYLAGFDDDQVDLRRLESISVWLKCFVYGYGVTLISMIPQIGLLASCAIKSVVNQTQQPSVSEQCVCARAVYTILDIHNLYSTEDTE